MEDLLRDDEFMPQKDIYNPWSRFTVMYGVLFFLLPSFFAFNKFVIGAEMNDTEIALLVLFTPLLLIIILIFSDWKVIMLSFKTIVLAVEILMLVYFCSFIAMAIISDGYIAVMKDKEELIFAVLFLGIFLGEGLVMSFLMLPVIRVLKRRKIADAAIEKFN